jgi:hypothetical protein
MRRYELIIDARDHNFVALEASDYPGYEFI